MSRRRENVNSGKPWSDADLLDLQNRLGCNQPIKEVAVFLLRDLAEVRKKATELGLLAKNQGRDGSKI